MTAIPVSLLTGFLGSGKTTLLNALLKHPDMARTAVVINEFGDIALDHDLIESASETMVLMGSGCLCCTVRGDLAQTLVDLRDRRAAGDVDFERIVIETTGIADPGPIVQTLVMDGDLTHDFALDGVLVTADAANGQATLDQHFEAVQQIAMADRIVVTKTDLITPAQRAAFERRLERLNPGAPRLVADHGTLDPAALFGVAPRAESQPKQTDLWAPAIPAALPLTDAARPSLSGLKPLDPLAAPVSHGLFAPPGGGAQPAPLPRSHDGRITSQSLTLDTPIAPIVFDLWLEGLITAKSNDILRLKAVVHLEGMEHPFALHGVQHIFHPPLPLTHWPHGDTTSRFVVIGRDLPPGYLAESLAILRSKPSVTHHI